MSDSEFTEIEMLSLLGPVTSAPTAVPSPNEPSHTARAMPQPCIAQIQSKSFAGMVILILLPTYG
jgi:hypothetical protein